MENRWARPSWSRTAPARPPSSARPPCPGRAVRLHDRHRRFGHALNPSLYAVVLRPVQVHLHRRHRLFPLLLAVNVNSPPSRWPIAAAKKEPGKRPPPGRRRLAPPSGAGAASSAPAPSCCTCPKAPPRRHPGPLGGQVDVFIDLAAGLPNVKAGKLRVLAAATPSGANSAAAPAPARASISIPHEETPHAQAREAPVGAGRPVPGRHGCQRPILAHPADPLDRALPAAAARRWSRARSPAAWKSRWARPSVENRPGAATIIGATAVSQAEPSGYMIGTADSGTLAFNPSCTPSCPTTRPVHLHRRHRKFPLLLAVNVNSPYKSVADVIAAAKKEPGKLTAASAGAGSPHHLALELFKQRTGAELLHVPSGAAPAIQDLLGGQVDVMFIDLAAGLPNVKLCWPRPRPSASPCCPTRRPWPSRGSTSPPTPWQGLVRRPACRRTWSRSCRPT